MKHRVGQLSPRVHRRAREGLHQSEARFRSLVADTTSIVWVASPDGTFIEPQLDWEEYTGQPWDLHKGMGWVAAIHPDDRERIQALWSEALARRAHYAASGRIWYAPSREYRHFVARAVPALSGDGSLREWVGFITDIHDSKQQAAYKQMEEIRRLNAELESRVEERAAEIVAVNLDLQRAAMERERAQSDLAQLLEQEQVRAAQQRGLADAALAINASLSVSDTLQVITDQARHIIGAHEAVTSLVVGSNWAKSVIAFSFSDKYAAWRSYTAVPDGSGIYSLVCKSNAPVRMTQRELLHHPAFHRFSKETTKHPPMRGWLAAPLIGRDGSNLGLIQLSDKYEGDFTEQDEVLLVQLAQMASAAIENARLYQQTQEAVEVRDDFLSVASHELKTPITSIKAYAQLLARQGEFGANERVARSLKSITVQAERLTMLVNDLLDVSRIEMGQLVLVEESVDLLALIEEVTAQAQILSDDHTITVHNEAGSVEAVGDRERLRQVLVNLVENAIKYSPTGGPVKVDLAMSWESESGENGESIMVSVSDMGIGIPAHQLDRVFDRFYRAPNASVRNYGGLGLGLHISKEIVQRHGGRMWVESVEGAGSRFLFSLPVDDGRQTTDDGR